MTYCNSCTGDILKTNLGSIASLRSGIYAKPERIGVVRYLQAGDFDAFGTYDDTLQPDLEIDDRISNHLLEANDILLVAKGARNVSVAYREGMGKAVASSIFMVVRISRPEIVLSEYLVWYLNHPQSQDYFKSESRGSGIPSLNQQSVEKISISIPSLDKQRAIVEYAELARRENTLRHRLDGLRDQMNQSLLLNAIR
jgi:restriction endonuclease S subunit